jgi:hypothetical protein
MRYRKAKTTIVRRTKNQSVRYHGTVTPRDEPLVMLARAYAGLGGSQ